MHSTSLAHSLLILEHKAWVLACLPSVLDSVLTLSSHPSDPLELHQRLCPFSPGSFFPMGVGVLEGKQAMYQTLLTIFNFSLKPWLHFFFNFFKFKLNFFKIFFKFLKLS